MKTLKPKANPRPNPVKPRPKPVKPPVVLTRLHPAPEHCRIYNASSSDPRQEPYRVVVNLREMKVSCSCKNFLCTLRPLAEKSGQETMVHRPEYHCRHIRRAVCQLQQAGEIRYFVVTPHHQLQV